MRFPQYASNSLGPVTSTVAPRPHRYDFDFLVSYFVAPIPTTTLCHTSLPSSFLLYTFLPDSFFYPFTFVYPVCKLNEPFFSWIPCMQEFQLTSPESIGDSSSLCAFNHLVTDIFVLYAEIPSSLFTINYNVCANFSLSYFAHPVFTYILSGIPLVYTRATLSSLRLSDSRTFPLVCPGILHSFNDTFAVHTRYSLGLNPNLYSGYLLAAGRFFSFTFPFVLQRFGEPFASLVPTISSPHSALLGTNRLDTLTRIAYMSTFTLQQFGEPLSLFSQSSLGDSRNILSNMWLSDSLLYSHTSVFSLARVSLAQNISSPFSLNEQCSLTSPYRSDILVGKELTSPYLLSESRVFPILDVGELSKSELIITQIHGNELREEALLPPESFIVDDEVHVWLDSYLIDSYVQELNITIRRDDILDDVELSVTPPLYNLCDPMFRWGRPRIRVQIRNDVYEFLLETRDRASELNQSVHLWGRHPAAVLTEPFSTEVGTIYTRKYASEIAADLAGSVPLEWNAYDFFVEVFTVEGLPLDAISRLAQAAGALVRTRHNPYKLVVEPKLPTRPRDFPVSPISMTLNRYDNLIGCELNDELPNFTAVRVQGATTQEVRPELELDETCINIGDVYSFRVIKPYKEYQYSICATDEHVQLIMGDINLMEQREETVVIESGKGSLSRRPFSILTYEWVSGPKTSSCDTLSSTPIVFSGSDIMCENVELGILRVTYNILFDVWYIKSDVECTSALALMIPEEEGVLIEVYADPDRVIWGPTINDDLITTEKQALLCAQMELDLNYYRKRKFTVETPYLSLRDGQLVLIDDDFWSFSGVGVVWSADISVDMRDRVAVTTQTSEVWCFQLPVWRG